MSSLWLDLRHGAAGLEGPFLQEYHALYRLLAKHAGKQPELIMLIRGPQRIVGSLPYPGSQVHIRQVGLPLFLLADCGLHLLSSMEKVKAFASRHAVQHCIQGAAHRPAGEIARMLYARCLSLFTTVVVFLAEEFGSLSQIVSELAGLANAGGAAGVHRPRVVVYTAQHGAWDSKKLGWELTTEMLANYNPAREMSTRTAEAAWRGFFMDLNIFAMPRSEYELYRQLQEFSSAVPRLEFTSTQYGDLFQGSIRQFCKSHETPLSLVRISHPTSPATPRGSIVVDGVKHSKMATMSEWIASILAIHAYPSDAYRTYIFQSTKRSLTGS